MGNSKKREERSKKAQQKKVQQIATWGVIALAIVGLGWWLSQDSGTRPNELVGNGVDKTVLFEDDHIKGAENPTVTLVEYGDFQCPACASVAPIVADMVEMFPNDLRVVFRHYPLTAIHPHAVAAARAAEAASQQGKFWEMHDILFERQREWAGGAQGAAANPINFFSQYATELGLDVDQFGSDFTSAVVRDKVNRDANDATSRSLRGTPSFLLNGEEIPNPGSAGQLAAMIQAAIDAAPLPDAPQTAVHEHADIAVFIDGTQLDFSLPKYQSPDDDYKHEYLHFHDGVGTVVHKHQTGHTLGDLFESIGIGFSRGCLTLDTGERYCNTNTKSLKFFVNGEENAAFDTYEFSDEDQILISYGPTDEDVSAQLAAVTDDACIYSETCPERGTPPTESCVGGLGTTCDSGSHSE